MPTNHPRCLELIGLGAPIGIGPMHPRYPVFPEAHPSTLSVVQTNVGVPTFLTPDQGRSPLPNQSKLG